MSVAPALSTNQEADLFSQTAPYSKEELALRRSYLGPHSADNLKNVINEYYSLDALTKRLNEVESTKIALQFPDELMQDSAIISQILRSKVDSQKSIWILADTSYSPCCIDTIAAEHSTSTHIVHFGDACLNPVQNLSATYVFGKPHIDLDKIASAALSALDDDSENVCLMADACNSYSLFELKEKMIKLGWKGQNLIVASLDSTLPTKEGQDVVFIDYPMQNGTGIKVANRILEGLHVDDIDQKDSNEFNQSLDAITQSYNLIHLTTPSDSRMLLLNTKFQTVTYVDPKNAKISSKRPPNLMKRYKFMHEARSASTIGILLNTLSLSNTLKLMNTIVDWVHKADKKHYLFVVGKPNVAKLANFECVDVWCVIGCGENGIIIDQYNEYWRPIVTPYELWLALGENVQWQGKWVVDFNQVLENNPSEGDADEANESDDDYNSEDDAPEFNPVTGKLSLNKPLRQLKHLELEMDQSVPELEQNENAVVSSMSGQLTIKNTISLAAMHLQDRAWTGLGSDFTNDCEEAAEIEEGRTGIARDYLHDKL